VAVQTRADARILVIYRTQYYWTGSFVSEQFGALLEPDGAVVTNPLWTFSSYPNAGELITLASGGAVGRNSELFLGSTGCWGMCRMTASGEYLPIGFCDWPAADYKDGRLIVGTNILDTTTNLIGTLRLAIPREQFGPAPGRDMLIQNDSRIVVGGSFNSINGVGLPYLARLITETNAGPPVITYGVGTSFALPGHPAALSVQVSSRDPVTFQWRRAGVDLPGATNSTLVIGNPSGVDAGSTSWWFGVDRVKPSAKAIWLWKARTHP
jgi:hypothetical protein